MTVELQNIRKSFDGSSEVLNGINLHIREGELTALLGPSGGGKTTLLRIVAGLESPSEGEVLLRGKKVNHLPPQQRGIGFVFQNYALFAHMNVYQNIAFGLKIKKQSKRIINHRVQNMMQLLGLSGLEHRSPDQLSGGQRQRVALARALAPEPEVLLLDEPFAAVDAELRRELRSWLRHLHDHIKVTSIFVTHDQQDALELADRVAVLNQGLVEQIGTPQEIYEKPQTRFIASFLGGANYYQAAVQNGLVRLGIIDVAAPGWNEQARVGIAIRPSDVEIEPYQGQPQEPAALVLESTFLGEFYKVKLDLSDEITITAHVNREKGRNLQRGAQVKVKALESCVFTA